MKSIRVLPVVLALALAACGSSGAPSRTDGGADRALDMASAGGHGGGGAGTAGHAGGGAGGVRATGGAVGGSGGGAGQGGAGGIAGKGGTGGVAGQGGAGGIGGQGGAGGIAGQGGAGPHDAGADAVACSSNPDPCLCGRPDANSISASECAQEKACRAAGGVWEPYEIFLEGGGHYGPRCQTRDGGPLDAS